MTAAEHEISRLLTTYADRLEVSDTEVHRAHRQLRQRLEARARRTKRAGALTLVAAAVVGALVLDGGWPMHGRPVPAVARPAAPSSPAPAVSSGNGAFGTSPGQDALALAGVWKVRGGGETTLLVRFDPDHTFAFDDRGHLGDPAAYGQFRLEGNRVVFTNLGGYACGTEETWSWLTTRRADGVLDIVHDTSSPGSSCGSPRGTSQVLTRVSPRSTAGVRLALAGVVGPVGQLVTGNTEEKLHGVWLHEGTGRLLVMSADGSYAVDDGGTIDSYPDDTGTFALAASGRVQLTSGVDWETCRAGSRVGWTGVRVTARRLTIAVSSDECSLRPGLAGRWARLS